MSELKVNKISPKTACGTTTLGDSGDTFTIPAGVTITNNGTQTGFGRTGTVDWQTGSIKTANFTAVSGEGYFCDTSSGAFEVDLPAGSAGAIVALKDYAGTWDTNNLTVDPNGSDKIGGGPAGETAVLSTENASVTLVYVDATKGWLVVNDATQGVAGLSAAFVAATGGTVTTVCTNFKVHTFTGPGTFCVSNAGNSKGSNSVDYMVLAGGGSGGSGSGNQGGGGGAGGYRESSGDASGCYSIGLPANNCVSALTVTATSFPITVGAGGSAVTNSGSPANGSNACGSRGSNSSFSTITSTGGGGGGNANSTITNGPGGSGGGAGGGGQCRAAGAGNTPSVVPSQGNPGGSISPPHSPDIASTGGGGASAAGKSTGPAVSDSNPQQYGANGGIGVTTSINGTATGFAGGGGGGSYSEPGSGEGNNHNWPNGKAATPGVNVCATAAFGGGKGGNWNNPSSGAGGESGGANKGGGGGGTGYQPSGAGGSGIVIIRYKFQ